MAWRTNVEWGPRRVEYPSHGFISHRPKVAPASGQASVRISEQMQLAAKCPAIGLTENKCQNEVNKCKIGQPCTIHTCNDTVVPASLPTGKAFASTNAVR